MIVSGAQPRDGTICNLILEDFDVLGSGEATQTSELLAPLFELLVTGRSLVDPRCNLRSFPLEFD